MSLGFTVIMLEPCGKKVLTFPWSYYNLMF